MKEGKGFSALQRAEIAEILKYRLFLYTLLRFSALQRAEIAEILRQVL